MSVRNEQSITPCPSPEDGQDWVEDYGSALKDIRRGANISQAKLAERANYDHSFVSRLESGSREPSREATEALSVALESDEMQTDRLLASAGYRGRGNTIPFNETEMLAVNAILINPETPEKTKERIRAILAALGDLALSHVRPQGSEE